MRALNQSVNDELYDYIGHLKGILYIIRHARLTGLTIF